MRRTPDQVHGISPLALGTIMTGVTCQITLEHGSVSNDQYYKNIVLGQKDGL